MSEIILWGSVISYTGIITYFDLKNKKIPNIITYPAIIIGIIIALYNNYYLGIAIATTIILAGPLIKKIGMGDIKYLASIQLLLGNFFQIPISLLFLLMSVLIKKIGKRKGYSKMGPFFFFSIIILFFIK